MIDLALVYNCDVRDNGSPAHIKHAFRMLEAALGGELKVTHYTPHGMLPEHDFYLYLDDGRDDIRWLPPRPSGFWAVDTHLGYEFRRWRASNSDLVWCAQKAGAERMTAEGILASWLPLACNPLAHPTAEELAARDGARWPRPEIKHSIGWVGYLQPPGESDRIDLLDRLFREFPDFTCGFGVFHEDAAHVLHSARIGINHSIRGDLNMRFFELASMGVPQVCPEMDGLQELGFRPGVHYFPYVDADDAAAVIRKTLEWPEIASEVAGNALRAVRLGHRYTHRATRILGDIRRYLDRAHHVQEAVSSEGHVPA